MTYCIEQFGPDRCMFESNFPVDKVSFSYNVLYNAFKRLSKPIGGGTRGGPGEPFEGVVQHRVRERHLVDREIAFEHAALGAELLDAIVQQRRDRGSELLRADRRLRVCQSNPVRGIPMPPSLSVTFGHFAMSAMPLFQAGITSPSLPANGPMRLARRGG